MDYTDEEMNKFLSCANWELGDGTYHKSKKSYIFQDFCKSVIIGRQLQAENKGLKKLIEEL